MAIIKCKMCGGDIELSTDKTYGICEFCGSTMTLPKVDDEQRAAAFNRGNHFRRIGEFDKALTVYESLVRDNETDAEAHWCSALCRFGIEYVKDPISGEYMPTCHRASFDSFLEDVDTKAAIEYADAVAKHQYEHDAHVIEDVRRGILTLSQNEKPYDVFICYKETDDKGQRTIDSQRAQEIYYQLTDQGRRVFFARITLEDKAGQQYEPYIFAALNSARVMIVVGTKREHLEAVWVKNEWSRFLTIMKRDRKKLLIPCYAEMDPYDMPEQLSVLQSYDMTKIGFIQDLLRGISKVLDADKKPEQPYVSPEQTTFSSNVNALLKRGYMALEDSDWDKAREFFEQILNQDAECAEAYMGEVFAENRVPSLKMFIIKRKSQQNVEEEEFVISTDESSIEEAIRRYEIPRYFNAYEIRRCYEFKGSYTSSVKYWSHAKETVESNRHIMRALKYAKGAYKQELDGVYQNLMAFYDEKITEAIAQRDRDKKALEQEFSQFTENGEKKVTELYNEGLARRERDYSEACKTQIEAERENDSKKLEQIAERFEFMGDYKDSKMRKNSCVMEARRIREGVWQEELASIKKEKIKGIIKYGLICAAVILLIIYSFYIMF